MPASPGHTFSLKEPGSKRANSFFFQPKLTINEPNDIYEQEADAAADKVMRMPDNNIVQTNFFKPPLSSLQLKCANCEEEQKLKRKVNSHSDFQTQTDPFFIQRQEANETTPAPANDESETSSASSRDFLLPTPSLLQPPGTPDFLSMRQPFLNRGVPGSWNPDAALRVWNYNFNFFRGAGISPSLSTTLTNFTAPRAIDAQLRLSNPTWWEVTDRDLNTSTIGGSIPLLEFNADFSPTAPSWLRSILGGGQKGVRRKCADRVNEEKMQRKEKANESTTADGGFENYINDLDNNGQSMPTEVRNFYEPRFGYNFSNVKIHTDTVAAKSAQSINALAYTSGNNIVFNCGEYSPKTGAGKKLLAHELTHVVQQGSGNISIQRQGTPPLPPMQSFQQKIRLYNTSSISVPSTSGSFIQRAPVYNSSLSQPTQRVVLPVVGSAPISDADFNLIMHHKFGVQNISTGTQQEQETSLTRHNQPPATIPNWQSWNPGSSSMIYNYIVEAFEQFGKSLGATPIVSTITFYKMNYDRDATGAVISQPTVGASFGLTDLNIFEAVTTLNSPLPYTRSITGTYRNSPVVGSTTTGSTPGAPMPVPSRSESVIRMITHELGHGAQSAAMNLPNPAQAPDPQMLNDFELAVGWTGSPMKLFDIGVPAVATALSAGTTPGSQYEITPAHWNDPRWIEQPMSHYSVDGGPGEDFAEAIMVYVNDPALLQSRSPARYNIIRNRSGMWLFNMRLYNNHPSAPGDYPQRVLPEGSEYA